MTLQIRLCNHDDWILTRSSRSTGGGLLLQTSCFIVMVGENMVPLFPCSPTNLGSQYWLEIQRSISPLKHAINGFITLIVLLAPCPLDQSLEIKRRKQSSSCCNLCFEPDKIPRQDQSRGRHEIGGTLYPMRMERSYFRSGTTRRISVERPTF